MSEQRATERTSPRPESLQSGSPYPGRPELLWRHLVGEQLREIRRSRGETLRHVAKRADVSP
ncbi:hypothetical protein [Glaciihabitans sp. dw_435]|uniref:hypothetical protein n=1 Tax=Glaciihabitans sp. dw_435 TaxID=2720081 RepID=UPI0023DEF3E2|nr:hypothetical protein [Glaciihabitans sp. dw_435]